MMVSGITDLAQFYGLTVEYLKAFYNLSADKTMVLKSNNYDLVFINDTRIMLFSTFETAYNYANRVLADLIDEVVIEEEEITIGIVELSIYFINISSIKKVI